MEVRGESISDEWLVRPAGADKDTQASVVVDRTGARETNDPTIEEAQR
jgi:hypothetical protein